MVQFDFMCLVVLAAGFGAMAKTGVASSGMVAFGSSLLVKLIKRKMPKKAKWTLPIIGMGLGGLSWWTLNRLGMPGAAEIANGFSTAFDLPTWGGDAIAGAASGGLGSLGYSSVHSYRKNKTGGES